MGRGSAVTDEARGESGAVTPADDAGKPVTDGQSLAKEAGEAPTAGRPSSRGRGRSAPILRVRIGPQTYLRRPRIADVDEFLELVAASRELHGAWVHPPSDLSTFLRYVALGRTETRDHLFICEAKTGAIAGVVNIANIVHGQFLNATIGYYANAALSGRGLMTEGLGLVLDHAFNQFGLHRVEANIQPANEASRRLVLRLGFRLEGYSPRFLRIAGDWRDHERFAILAEEWETIRGRLFDGPTAPPAREAIWRAAPESPADRPTPK